MTSIAVSEPARPAMSTVSALNTVPAPHPTDGWVREYAVERAESTSAVRGLAVAALLSLPLWALLIAGANALFSAFA